MVGIAEPKILVGDKSTVAQFLFTLSTVLATEQPEVEIYNLNSFLRENGVPQHQSVLNT